MKVLLIKASNDSDFKKYKKYTGTPPQGLYSMAAASPDYIEQEILDETIGDSAPQLTEAEVVVLFASTPDVTRAYKLATQYRSQGKLVVLAGLHVSFLPEEALEYGDVVIIGEADIVWPQLLSDINKGNIKPRYQSMEQVDMATLKPWLCNEKLKAKYPGWTISVGRGCPYRCSYCTVRPFFKTSKYRPISAIIDEIKAGGHSNLELHADNLCADKDYAMELFSALAPLNIAWSGESTLDFAEDDELLAAAANSGLWYLVVGLETCSQLALKKAGKGFIKVDRAQHLIEKLHDHNVIVDSCMLFGFDQHQPGIFDESIDFIKQVKLDVIHPNIVTPFPGTPLFNQLQRERRILTTDWQRYDCSQAVFQPKHMSVEQLEYGVDKVYQAVYSSYQSLKRKARVAKMQGLSAANYIF